MTHPAPLVPADVDLQDFAYMPLDVRRLRDSDMSALESPECCWAGLLLWAASWHQVPAASVPDDDRILAQLAGYGRVVKEWLRVKEGALRNFVLCDDGRFYHPVVAEKALEAWQSKLHHAHKKLTDRLRKENKAIEASGGIPLEVPSFDQWNASRSGLFPLETPQLSAGKSMNSSGKGDGGGGIPPENSLKGEGEVRERDIKPKTPGERGLRIPRDWTPSPPGLAAATAERPDLDLNVVTANFRDHALALLGDQALCVDWEARWRIWIRREWSPTKSGQAPENGWRASDAGIVRKGCELGMEARAGESMSSFADRIGERLRKSKASAGKHLVSEQGRQ